MHPIIDYTPLSTTLGTILINTEEYKISHLRTSTVHHRRVLSHQYLNAKHLLGLSSLIWWISRHKGATLTITTFIILTPNPHVPHKSQVALCDLGPRTRIPIVNLWRGRFGRWGTSMCSSNKLWSRIRFIRQAVSLFILYKLRVLGDKDESHLPKLFGGPTGVLYSIYRKSNFSSCRWKRLSMVLNCTYGRGILNIVGNCNSRINNCGELKNLFVVDTIAVKDCNLWGKAMLMRACFGIPWVDGCRGFMLILV